MNPYDELGVGRDATDADIRKAYRKKARKAHPDAGGSREKFEKLSTATAVLLDPRRREQYDKFGKFDDYSPQQDKDHAALTVIGHMLQAFISQQVEVPKGANLIKDIISRIKDNISQHEVERFRLQSNLKRIKKLRKRVRKKSKGKDHIQHILEFHESGLRRQIDTLNQMQNDHNRAINILNDYEFDVEVLEQMLFVSTTMTT